MAFSLENQIDIAIYSSPMANRLFLQCDDRGIAQWVLMGDEGLINSGDQFDPDVLDAAGDAAVLVLVPTEQVTLRQTTIATRQRGRLSNAIPFALEEELAQSVENLHFAFVQDPHEAVQHVAVVDQQHMQAWVDVLQELDCKPNAMFPDVFCLPHEPATWQVLCTPTRALVQTGAYQGFATTPELLIEFLQQALTEQADQAPNHIHIYTTPGKTLNLPQDAHSLAGVPVQLTQVQDEPLFWLASQLTTQPLLGLLQGTFQDQKKRASKKSLWQRAKIAALIWLAIVIVGNITQFTLLNKQLKAQTASIKTLYQQAFPQATTVISPGIRIQQRLKQLQQLRTGGAMLTLLKRSAEVLQQDKAIQVTQLDFRGKALSLAVTANSFQQLQQFTARLKQTGLRVQQKRASGTGKVVKADITLELGAR